MFELESDRKTKPFIVANNSDIVHITGNFWAYDDGDKIVVAVVLDNVHIVGAFERK